MNLTERRYDNAYCTTDRHALENCSRNMEID